MLSLRRLLLLAVLLAFSGLLAACDNGNGAMEEADMLLDDSEGLAEMPPVARGDMTEGQASAPVTIIEYASMTCNHCAAFYFNEWPRLKEEYVDPGKARLIFREFPLDGIALSASMLARCAGKDKYFEVVDKIFTTQNDFFRQNSNPINVVRRVARSMGFSNDQFDQCIANEDIRNAILARYQEAQAKYNINGTPAFVLNGQRFEGAPTYETMAAAIDAILAAQ